jgi:hypothetical protein
MQRIAPVADRDRLREVPDVTEAPNITHMILEKIQDDIAALRDRLSAFEARMERRWEANDARWEANDARWEANDARWEANEALWVEARAYWTEARAHWTELADEQRAWRKRFEHEQVVRERNARKTLELFDVLIRKVERLDDRVTRIEGEP